MQEDFKSLKPEQLEALKQLLGEAYNVQLPDASDWFDGKQIDEIAFGEYLLRKKERNVSTANFMIWMEKSVMR